MAYKIFMCYRRDDKGVARAIERRLVREFGDDAVFLDFESVGGGRDWKQKVEEGLADQPKVVSLITTKWNSRRGGKPKLLIKSDHVRFELERALERGCEIVPLVYGRTTWPPQEEHLPPSLLPMRRFQKVPLDDERWEFDEDQLVRALRDLLGEPAKKKTTKTKTQKRAPTATSPTLPTLSRPSQPMQTFTSSMFRETPTERKAREAAAKKEEERIQRARAESPAFYARWAFWTSALVSLAAASLSVVGAEALAHQIASDWTTLPGPPEWAGVAIAVLWALTWTALGAAAYWADPERGARVFFTRGVLGGYTLYWEDIEPIGLWAAFPVTTGVLWLAARWLAWAPTYFWDWRYGFVFWAAIVVYTVPVFVIYLLHSLDDTI